jgi:hypothetical protein
MSDGWPRTEVWVSGEHVCNGCVEPIIGARAGSRHAGVPVVAFTVRQPWNVHRISAPVRC